MFLYALKLHRWLIVGQQLLTCRCIGPCLTGLAGVPAEQQGVQLSEGAIWYGLHMLERAGGTMRQHIATENMYEQRLLPEVVSEMSPVRMYEQRLVPQVVREMSPLTIYEQRPMPIAVNFTCHKTAAIQ